MDLPVDAIPHVPENTLRWRRTALIAGGVATVELIALLVVALAFIAKPFAHTGTSAKASTVSASTASSTGAKSHPTTTKSPTAVKHKVVARVPRDRTGVLVLNGNGQYGAASEKAIVVRSLNYPVLRVGDARHRDYPRTIVMYRQGFEGEGVRLAHDLGLGRGRVVPLDGLRQSELAGAKLALIIGHAS